MRIDTGPEYSPPPVSEPVAGDGSGFTRHNITHLSASSLNLWKNAPDVWVMSYLHGVRGVFGPAPKRGQCVEDVVAAVLKGDSFTAAAARGLDRFDEAFPGQDTATHKERGLISDMAKIAIEELSEYGTPSFDDDAQHKITIRAAFDGWGIDLWGFLDFVFPDRGLVVDLKTTTRVPSRMSPDHQLQRAIYAAAKSNHAVKFLYCSASKANWLEDGDPATILAKAKIQIARLERFLAAHDAESAVACVPHNPDSFYWRDSEEQRFQFFGT